MKKTIGQVLGIDTPEDSERRREKMRQRKDASESRKDASEARKSRRKARIKAQKENRKGAVSHRVGFGDGTITEYPDGTVEWRRTATMLPVFSVNIREVTGFSTHKVKKDGKVLPVWHLLVQGSGTTLAEVEVPATSTAERIEDWFRAHPDFGANARTPAVTPVAPTSLADELAKLAGLRDSGVLTDDEFAEQKARLLSAS